MEKILLLPFVLLVLVSCSGYTTSNQNPTTTVLESLPTEKMTETIGKPPSSDALTYPIVTPPANVLPRYTATVDPTTTSFPALATPTATPTSFPVENLIAFVGLYKGSQSIGLMSHDGQNRRFATDVDGNDHSPKWSPDGTKIAFLSDRGLPGENYYQDLWLFDLATKNLIQATSGGEIAGYSDAYDWDSSGQRIIYASVDGVKIINLTDSTFVLLNGNFTSPIKWSPDNERIALIEYTQKEYGGLSMPFLAALDQRGNPILEPDEDFTASDGYPFHTGTGFFWSPDGQYLAIGSFFALRGVGNLTIVSFEKRETTVEATLFSYAKALEVKSDILGVSWSPEGTEIVFTLMTPEDEEWGFGRIFLTDANLSTMFPLTPEGRLCGSPQWSSDGTQIVFICKSGENNSDIWMINRDGSNLQQLTDTPANEEEPVWQPVP